MDTTNVIDNPTDREQQQPSSPPPSDPGQGQPAPTQRPTSGWRVALVRVAADVVPRLVGLVFLVAALGKVGGLVTAAASQIGAVPPTEPVPLTPDGPMLPTGLEQVEQVLMFDGFPAPVAHYLARGVVGLEFLLGGLLITGLLRRWTLHVTSIVLFVFSLQLGYLLMFEEAPTCGCISVIEMAKDVRTSNILGIVRNVLLIACLQWSWLFGPWPGDDELPVAPTAEA